MGYTLEVRRDNILDAYNNIDTFRDKYLKVDEAGSAQFMQLNRLDHNTEQVRLFLHNDSVDMMQSISIGDGVNIDDKGFAFRLQSSDSEITCEVCELYTVFIKDTKAAELSQYHRGFTRGSNFWATSEREAFDQFVAKTRMTYLIDEDVNVTKL
ncbi:hypothetical protein ACQ4M3_07865 [Leptolyngbya sp. AN03gr2]|uniref:hypothetical protein n=1 Tax=unclassified Leptolyngbya TaxID=2650499 RepID=UPI003D31D3B4